MTSTAHPMTPQGRRPRGRSARPTVRPGRAVTHRARMGLAADRRRAQHHRTESPSSSTTVRRVSWSPRSGTGRSRPGWRRRARPWG